jgi:hypothetical protein
MTIYDIAFDEDHDMYLDGADIVFTDEDTALVQRLTIRLQFLFEEWFLDNTVGIPYAQTIFDQGTSLEDIYSIFRKAISNTNGVESIQQLDLTPDPNEKGLRVDFAVNDNTASGTVEVTI